MYSVTSRIKMIKQPRGGYLNPKFFEKIQLENKNELSEEENIHASLVGLAVDYMVRYIMGAEKEEAFRISLLGAMIADETDYAHYLLSNIKGTDQLSIESACKLVGYDVCFRSGMAMFVPVSEIKPNKQTIENIKIMIDRSIEFWKSYGPITKDGFTFEDGYTETISSGDGDYLTKDTLWDFKVSKREIDSKQTLQILIYYIMGKHSFHPEFEYITKIGIFNPRLNKVFLLNTEKIDSNIIEEIKTEVIGY